MKGLAFVKDPDGYWIEILSSEGIAQIISENTANTSGLDSGSVFVDLVSLLKASNLDDLDNILNGLLDLFPILRVKIENDLQRDPLIVMEEVLDNLSEVTIAQETKSLLIGTAINQTYNKVINYSDTDLVIQGVLNNINSINLFYDYLSQFINLEIIHQKIVDSPIITPDPCFINFGSCVIGIIFSIISPQ